MHWLPVRIWTYILGQIPFRDPSAIQTFRVENLSRALLGELSRRIPLAFFARSPKRSGMGSSRFGRAFFVLTLLIIHDSKAQKRYELGRPLYQFFSTREYGGDNQNWSAVQDREGLVFFGNNSSVLDYDGQRWDHIPVAGGFSITGLAIDSTGTIWVGGSGKLGNLERDGNRFRFVPVKADIHLPSELGGVLDLACCGNAEFVRTERALLVCRNGSWDAIPWPHGNGFDYIVS